MIYLLCMPELVSINPYSRKINGTVPVLNFEQVDLRLKYAKDAFLVWRETNIEDRQKLMGRLSLVIRDKSEELAKLITLEMGCPISQARLEVDKTAIICDIIARQLPDWLAPEFTMPEKPNTYIDFQPLGTVFHIAPWNYPLYLALRPILPAVAAGNAVVFKHASNVPLLGARIEELFALAGFPDNLVQYLPIAAAQSEQVIAWPDVRVVTLIGSETAGSIVASTAGKHLKKSVMELGGSDPFVVFEDAELDKAIEAAAYSRLRNAGQSCNAAKRFIVHSSLVDRFCEGLVAIMKDYKIGDPMLDDTEMGPLASQSSINDAIKQIADAKEKGGKILFGGNLNSEHPFNLEPTLIQISDPQSKVWVEETFAPIAPIMTFDTLQHALELANNSRYGLGASIWTKDEEIKELFTNYLETGNLYFNSVVRGDPKLPYGGVKNSGYGREFGEYGIKEFVNIRVVVK